MSEEELIFNGINAATGDYLLPPLSEDEVADVALNEVNDELLDRLARWHRKIQSVEDPEDPKRALLDGDPRKLTEAGWGVVFPAGSSPAIRYALDQLLEHRREQTEGEYPATTRS